LPFLCNIAVHIEVNFSVEVDVQVQ